MIDIPHKDYFEGILQLRGNYGEILIWVRETTKKDKRAVITKEKKVRGGADLYYSSQHYLQALGKKLKQKFVGILKVSTRLHTRSRISGKEVYRVTVLFKPLPVKVGDVIRYQGDEYLLMHAGARATIKNVHSGKKKVVSLDSLDKFMR